ncbi:MAG: hypothetical protein IPJ82_11560 [Lewinellaceae bacterium]|nr:hypothetical protein [Lewinellaceae bacterium]
MLAHALGSARMLTRALENDRSRYVITLARDFGLDSELLIAYGYSSKLGEQIIDKIRNYFSANILIINCLESVNYVSKDVREKMLHENLSAERG